MNTYIHDRMKTELGFANREYSKQALNSDWSGKIMIIPFINDIMKVCDQYANGAAKGISEIITYII